MLLVDHPASTKPRNPGGPDTGVGRRRLHDSLFGRPPFQFGFFPSSATRVLFYSPASPFGWYSDE